MPNTKNGLATKILLRVCAIVLALGLTALVLICVKAPPLEAFGNILSGAFSSMENFSNVLVCWVPLLLVTMGLIITFTTGLWNIGIEGQIILGGVFATWALRLLGDSALSPALLIIIATLAGALGGALWAVLAGVLKTYGGVNEIFGGLGLNFVATAINLWLIFGPWKRPGIASMSGTAPFDEKLWLPTLPSLPRLAPASLVIGIVSIVIVYIIVDRSTFGLKIKAVGRNMRAAHIIGLRPSHYMMASFILCGIFAGIAGSLQVTAVYHRLIPSISSGYGYLGFMVAMLVNYGALWAAPVSLFFAALNVGSIQLPIMMQVDSSLAGVIQGTLVLSVLLAKGIEEKILTRGRMSK